MNINSFFCAVHAVPNLPSPRVSHLVVWFTLVYKHRARHLFQTHSETRQALD